MNPIILVWGFASFLVCLVFHILLWRTRRPKNDLLALFAIFIIVPFGCLAVIVLFLGLSGILTDFLSMSEIAAATVLHIALSCAYIQSYPPAQAVSPSLEIMIIVENAMPNGLSREEISAFFDNKQLVLTRFQDLVHTNLVEKRDGDYCLTPGGKKLIRFFVLYRKILGLEFKGG